MEKRYYETLQETLYYEKLANGLQVYLLPKDEYNKTFATFSTHYGSVDNHFVPLESNQAIRVPDGVAHFLEHKMFESPTGDVFQDFAKHGASANAFTSHDVTSYLFSCTSELETNLGLLLDFVQDPYFTSENVEKEKGIIGQEINMYEDNPDWRLYQKTLEQLYPQHPVGIDIAGTIDTISEITAETLYTCYHTFYHPNNMLLFVIGNFDVEQLIELIRENQTSKTFAEPTAINRTVVKDMTKPNGKAMTLTMDVSMPKVMVGIKNHNVYDLNPRVQLKNEVAYDFMLDCLFGASSINYDMLMEKGLINDSFGYSQTNDPGIGYTLMSSDTMNPEALVEALQTIVADFRPDQITTELVERFKRKNMGQFIRSLNSVEFIANQFTRYAFNGMNIFDVIELMNEVTTDDVVHAFENFAQLQNWAITYV
ncbi:MAG: EF-P 5-aminopentanol modification-associated protein YfmH, partial [Culicoidibacterales bacterium]